MQQYLDLVKRVLANGEPSTNRTGVKTLTVFGEMLRFDLREGFPILTTKKILWSTVVDELLWFIRGGHNVNDLDAPKKIWDAWAGPDGDLGRIYGVQWRSWSGTRYHGFDQLQTAIDRIRQLPNSRRNLVSAWNVEEIETKECSFPPCHVLFQFRRFGEYLDLALYQRSGDVGLGVPFNISSYALLLSMVAYECGLTARNFVHFLADCHIYENHRLGLTEQLSRYPRIRPKLLFLCEPGTPVVQMTREDFALQNYLPHPFIRLEVAV